MEDLIEVVVAAIVDAASMLLAELPEIFNSVLAVVFDGSALTGLGLIITGTAGFAFAWAGIRFVFGFVNRLLNKTRAGR